MSTSELRRLNHMYGTANLYSGQIIKVKQPSKVRMSAGANTSKVLQGETKGSSTRDLPSRSTMGSSLPLKKAAASTNLAHSQQKPTKLRVFLCTEPDHRIAGTLTMSYQLLLFEPSPSDAVVKEGGILKYQVHCESIVSYYFVLYFHLHEGVMKWQEKRASCLR